MNEELNKKLNEAVWIGKSLFERGRTSGSSANMSFLQDGYIYITRSGSCFGNLTGEDFVKVAMDGTKAFEGKPSKEIPLHKYYYEKDSSIQAVIHTHGFYSTLWSCVEDEKIQQAIMSYTPYLKMKAGSVAFIPYAKPGSETLFQSFRDNRDKGDIYLLRNHGGLVGGTDLMESFYKIEELEESAHIVWEIYNRQLLLKDFMTIN